MTQSQILKNQIDTDYQFLKEDFNAGMFNFEGGITLAMEELERIFSKFTNVDDWEDERYDFHPRPENVSEVL